MTSRVMVADDDRAIRESLATALELAGYDVTTCADGVQALAGTRSAHFDVVILDVMMPGVDGLGVCQVLRAEGNRVPILMVTARTETADRVAGLDAGADDGGITTPTTGQARSCPGCLATSRYRTRFHSPSR